MRYLLLWLEKERECCFAIQRIGGSEESRLIGIQRAASHFAVARNLPRKVSGDKSLEHYRPLLKVLDGLDPALLDGGWAGAITRVEKLIQKSYRTTTRLRSLTSKFLWLKFQRGVVIYDSQARKALGVRTDSPLDTYEKAWRQRFESSKGEILLACRDLASVLRFARNGQDVSESELRGDIKSRWFHERVLDMALWAQGRAS